MLEGISLIVAEKDQSKDLIKLVNQVVNYYKNYNKPFELIIVRNGQDQKEIDLPKEEFIKLYSIKDNLDNKEQVRIKKKENWLKPVKAAKIPSTYQYK